MSSDVSSSQLRAALREELAVYPDLTWRIQGLTGGSPAYVLSRILDGVARPTLVVAPSDKAAEELVAELQAFLGEKSDDSFLARRVHFFPGREAPPLEMVSPSVDVEASRTAALYQLAQSKAPILVAAVEALSQWAIPPDALAAASLYFVVGDELLFEELVPKLEASGYRKVATVDGYAYSQASKDAAGKGLVWSEAELMKYLENPTTYMPGTKMAYAGLKDQDAREDVIAYLKKAGK